MKTSAPDFLPKHFTAAVRSNPIAAIYLPSKQHLSSISFSILKANQIMDISSIQKSQ